MKHFEVVIAGAGIYGTALFYLLSQQSVNVALAEQGQLGQMGASPYSKAIARVYDPDPLLTYLSLLGVHEFNNWEKLNYPGATPYTASGALYRIAPKNFAGAAERIKHLASNGYTGEILSGKQASKRFPELLVNTYDQLIWESDGGYAEPLAALQSYVKAGASLGGHFFENYRIDELESKGDHWVIAAGGNKITADLILLTTGAFTRKLVPSLNVFTRSISILLVGFKHPASISFPIVDEILQTYARPEKKMGLFCGTPLFEDATRPEDLTPYGQPEKEDALFRIKRLIHKSCLGDPITGYKAFDCYTESKRPIIGFADSVPNLFIATGFSGRGFKYHLPVAKYITHRVCDHLGKRSQITNYNSCLNNLLKPFAVDNGLH
jgi:sarcosine oxidase